MIKYDELCGKYITDIFPDTEQQINKPTDSPDGFLPHVVFGDILNPIAVRLLKRDDYRENRQLRQLFDLYESFASSGDADTQDLLQTTLLEYLWDETVTYERAIELMGEKTREIWDNIRGYMKAP